MATTLFNSVLLDVARRLKAPRTLATDDTDINGLTSPYTSAILTKHINRSVRDLLIEFYTKFGETAFCEMFQQYIKTSGNLALSSGAVAKPTDCFYVLDLRTALTSSGTGGGKASLYPNGVGNWTASTKTLSSLTMTTAFSAADVGKKIMFQTATTGNVYFGLIASYVSATSVTVSGDNLPASDISTNDISAMVVDYDIWATYSATFFEKLKQKEVEDIRSGYDGLTKPSSTRPVFWEENGYIYTLGITTGNVVARYIVTHQDVTPVTSAVGNGNWATITSGAWNAATRALTTTMNTSFAATDVGKKIMFRSTTVTYFGIIERFVSTTSVIIRGDGLPGSDIPGTVAEVVVSDIDPDSSDLKLNQYWCAQVINRAVTYALQDSKSNVTS